MKEILGFQLHYAKKHDLQSSISTFMYSRESLLMVVPDLVRASAEDYAGQKVFYLHVPKTGGTSVRIALADAMGIPSFNIYPHSSHSLPSNLQSMDFWPYWAGHANIGLFPDTHKGFTTFRESRSRILSMFRQQQRSASIGTNPHIITEEAIRKQKFKKQEMKNLDFNSWIKTRRADTCLGFYIDNPTVAQSRKVDRGPLDGKIRLGSMSDWKEQVFAMPDREIKKELRKSLPRIVSASWIHQSRSTEEAIQRISGRSDVQLSRNNEFTKTDFFKIEDINAESMQILEDIRKKDTILFSMATDLGVLIDKLDMDEDAIFHQSVANLGYEIT
jgi:hypothetical protein